MQPFKVLQIAIKKRVLVIPFDLKRNHAGLELPAVINFVRDRFPFFAVDNLLNYKFCLGPSDVR